LKWRVLCLLFDEKCDALIRIIEAGHGNAYRYNESDDIKNDKYTLIVFSEEKKCLAESLSLKFNIPAYPYQAIPDYLMQVL
jgi:hypothetical protein